MDKNEKINLIFLSEIKDKNNLKKEESSKIEIKKQIGKKRYYILDNFKGILIFTVVFAHFLLDHSNSHMNSLSRKIVVKVK